jgi:hypothetical protein
MHHRQKHIKIIMLVYFQNMQHVYIEKEQGRTLAEMAFALLFSLELKN